MLSFTAVAEDQARLALVVFPPNLALRRLRGQAEHGPVFDEAELAPTEMSHPALSHVSVLP